MKNLNISLLIVLAILFSSSNQAIKEDPAPYIKMEDFFRNGEKDNFQISPDGNYFSYISGYKGFKNVFVEKISDGSVVRVTSDTVRSIRYYIWKKDRILFYQDVGGDENFQIFSVKADGSDLKSLTPFPGVRNSILDNLQKIPGKENQIVVTTNKRDKRYTDPYLLNTETGEMTLLYENKENFNMWRNDNNGVIRLAAKTEGLDRTWHYRDSEKDEFKPLLTTSYRNFFTPWLFDKNNRNFFVASNQGRDKLSVVEYDPVANKEVRVLFTHDKYDIGNIYRDRKKQTLAYVEWEGEKNEKHFFDKEWEAVQKTIDKKFEGSNAEIYSYDDARTKAIIFTESDRSPGKYYLYDFKTGEIRLASDPYPWIEEKYMSYMKPITYTSRDGLEIHGYLTIPVGMEAKNLPVVVNPHGGPWARDTWRFNREVQFLANRGYAVFQLNFRGSTGYGKQFQEAGYRQWGRKMQDDITDGVEWLIKEGIADKDRVGIFGGSYGGYATLAGVAFTPDLYAAAISYVGISNLFTFMESLPFGTVNKDPWYDRLGNPKKDSLEMAAASPALHADKIKTPLFVVQGANDQRVKKSQSDEMVEALRKRGVEVEYMVKDNEGHGFINEQNKFDFYAAMEKFLEKYLKPEKKRKPQK